MILRFNYEEVTALRHGGETLLHHGEGEGAVVTAPAPSRAVVGEFLDQLEGDLSVSTLEEQMRIESAVRAIVGVLRAEMESAVVQAHPADETAVASYFEFAHALSVLSRVEEMGSEMRAMIELTTGTPPSQDEARAFVFPD